ncbi:MAG: peroxiredoxin [Kiritimatiellae bacterium]|nr:peroxiredoxin [Kiritimatiellia bacterium]MCO6399741.1 peroxiredoxin [Verrucomicrobiota bacterium]
MIVGAALWSAVAPAWALREGEAAPDFRVASTAGRELSLSDFSGQWLALYFYPKAFTPGCTTEACSLRDGYSALLENGVHILGVSADSLETQLKFKSDYHLPFELLADEGGAVIKAYGAEGMGGGARRVTFLISPEGSIAKIIDDVRSAGHDAQILAAFHLLQAHAPERPPVLTHETESAPSSEAEPLVSPVEAGETTAP